MLRLFLVLFLFSSATAWADTLGLRVAGSIFDYEVSGSIRDSASATDQLDVKSVLGFQDDSDTQLYIYFEHPVPVLPNIRIGSTSLTLGGTGTTPAAGFTFDGTVFPGSTSITSEFDFSHQEIALYYEILDNIFSLDLGLNVKFFDGDISLAAVGTSVSEKFDGTIPMLYVAAGVDLPLTGLSIVGDLSFVSAGDASFTDYLIRVQYVTDFLLGVELGYRSITLDYEDTGANEFADLTVEGPYLSLMLAF